MRIVSDKCVKGREDSFTCCGLCADPDFMKVETTLDGAVVSAIERHYDHAREKHPYFCDRLIPGEDYAGDVGEEIANNLREISSRIERSTESKRCEWDELLNEEVWEILEAIHDGNNAHAVEECYDAIAVLLRVIDVLEGRQVLGRPKEGGASCGNTR